MKGGAGLMRELRRAVTVIAVTQLLIACDSEEWRPPTVPSPPSPPVSQPTAPPDATVMPEISSISPTFGPVGGGTTVRVTGTGFQPGAFVTLGNVRATTTVVSSTEITATTPPRGVARVDVAVVNANGRRASLRAAFLYTDVSGTVWVFTDPVSGFRTSEIRDAEDEIVQFSLADELIWVASGDRLAGFPVVTSNVVTANDVDASKVCACWFTVRFGIKNGERRAYLTGEYGHYNPATVLDLEVVNGALTVTQTDVYPPGTLTLSGVVTELTSSGVVPVEGATVYRGYGSGWQEAVTDRDGFYRIRGLYEREDAVQVMKEGYMGSNNRLAITGDTQFDVRLVRR